MSHIRRVVICGRSLFLMAIEAGLAALPDTEVLRIEQPTVSQLKALAPTLIIAERNRGEAMARALVNCGLSLIELDIARSEASVFSAQHVPAGDVDDLTRLIEELLPTEFKRKHYAS
ncbi:MAG: hypothetical protein MAG451_01576 [Anaerolineales bacterium]|nr:hypothetical protein [Anaerolineales bacterium]